MTVAILPGDVDYANDPINGRLDDGVRDYQHREWEAS